MAVKEIDFACDVKGCGHQLSLASAPWPGCFRDMGWIHLDGDFVRGRHLCPEHGHMTAAEVDATHAAATPAEDALEALRHFVATYNDEAAAGRCESLDLARAADIARATIARAEGKE
jgi:hypothetical protein